MSGLASPFTVVIPARFNSTRLPGKPLVDIAGKPMIQHVYDRACESEASRVIIGTDDERIYHAARAFGAEVCMTQASHPSGTDRLHEVARIYEMFDDDIVVNIQGDEPLIPAAVINQVAQNLVCVEAASAATLAERIQTAEDLFNPSIVKVVCDHAGMALYFSRSPMPWARGLFARVATEQQAFDYADVALPEPDLFRRHIGIYAYRVSLLNRFVSWGQSPIESLECLEQLRMLWNGQRIYVADALESSPPGVDTEDDLRVVRTITHAAAVSSSIK